MFNLQFPIDPKLAAAIQRRRVREDERRKIILDEKKRRIGIDVSALAEQTRERKEREVVRRKQDETIDQQMLRNDEMAVKAHRRYLEQKRQFDRDVDKFRLTCQIPEIQRDFDLNNPNRLKYEGPPREGDYDSLIGPSSLQKFAGEDIWKTERDTHLKALQKVWLDNQKQEKLAINKKFKDTEATQDAEMIRQANAARHQMAYEKNYRQNLEKAIQNYNQHLFQNKVALTQMQKQREFEMNIVEMKNHIFSDILSEDPAMAISSFGAHRVIPDRWKGMSAEQVGHILKQQREQALEKKLMDATEKHSEAVWDHKLTRHVQSEILKEKQQEQILREYRRQLMEENKKLALQQKNLQKHLNQNVYRGVTSNDFFSQFGQSCR